MSCYTLEFADPNIKNITFLTSKDFTKYEGNDLTTFFKELSLLSDSEISAVISMALDELVIDLVDSLIIPKINPLQRKDFNNIIKRNLSSLGVTMNIVTSSEFTKIFGNATAGIKNGEIFVPDNNTDVTAPVHELSHLIMSVFKLKQFDEFLDFLFGLSNIKEFTEIETLLAANENYSGLSRLDIKEEAFARFLEMFVDNKIDFNTQVTDSENLYEYLQMKLAPILQQIFSLENSPNVYEFFSATISDIPTFGTSLFFPKKMETTGYLQYRNYAIQNAKIVNKIKEWVKNRVLTEIDC